MKLVHVGEPPSFLDHVCLGCEPIENGIEEYRKMFESRISGDTTGKLPGWEKHHAKTVAWSCDMEGHAKKCVERCRELSNKRQRGYTQFQLLAWVTTTYRKRKKMNWDRFDALSTPLYVIEKGTFHGARHGNTERQRIFHAAHIAA